MESLPDRPAQPDSAAPAGRGLNRILRPQPVTTVLVIVALLLLVVCPLASLVFGSVTDTHGLTLRHFASALSDPLYLVPLWNSVELGVLTGFFSALVGVPLAWAMSRTDVPAKGFIQAVVNLSYISPPFLTAIAYVYLFSPRAGLINAFLRDVVGAPWLTFNIFSMAGLVLVTVPHTFPFVYPACRSALQSVDASYEEAAQILGAGKLRTALSVTFAAGGAGDSLRRAARLRQRHRPVRLAGDHRAAGTDLHPDDADLRAVRLSAAIWRRLGAVA